MTSCPTPTKIPYGTRAQAEKVMLATAARGIPMRVYRCPCGAYHLTRKNAPEFRTCGYAPCVRVFPASDERQLYCSPAHARKAHEKRRLARRRAETLKAEYEAVERSRRRRLASAWERRRGT